MRWARQARPSAVMALWPFSESGNPKRTDPGQIGAAPIKPNQKQEQIQQA
nr:hypothetical protein [uncultured Ottowia sp.]